MDTKQNRNPTVPCIAPREGDFRLAYKYSAKIKDTTALTSKTKVNVAADLATVLAAEFPAVDELLDADFRAALERTAVRVAARSASLEYQIFEATDSLWSPDGRPDNERICIEEHSRGKLHPFHIIGSVAVITYGAETNAAFRAELDVELKGKVAMKLGEGSPAATFDQSWERVKERIVDGVVERNSFVLSYSWPESY